MPKYEECTTQSKTNVKCVSPFILKSKSNKKTKTINLVKTSNIAKDFLSNLITDKINNYPDSKINVYSQENKEFIIYSDISLSNYWYDNNLDDNLLHEATDNLKLANLVLNSQEFIDISLEYKKYVLVASFLSNKKLDKNKKDILKIFNMSNADYVYTGDESYWKLIPKYISILNKIGNVGIFKFYNYCVENNSSTISSDMKEYINIIKKFKNNFNNKLIVELMNMRIEQIKSFEYTLYHLEKNNKILTKDIIHNLFY